MMRRLAVLAETRNVGGGAVPSVPLPSVPRVTLRQADEQVIPDHLGQDARARHRIASRIGVHHGRMVQPELPDRLPIYEKEVVRVPQAGRRPADRHGRGAQDIVALDFLDARRRYGIGERAGPDQRCQALPFGCGQLFGVGNTRDGPLVGRHHNGTNDDGARQGAPSDFIYSSDVPIPLGPQVALDCAPARHGRPGYSAASAAPDSGTFTRTRFSLMRAPLPASPRR